MFTTGDEKKKKLSKGLKGLLSLSLQPEKLFIRLDIRKRNFSVSIEGIYQ